MLFVTVGVEVKTMLFQTAAVYVGPLVPDAVVNSTLAISTPAKLLKFMCKPSKLLRRTEE